GNILCLEKRMKWRGIDCRSYRLDSARLLRDNDYDIVFIGGGQDFEQSLILKDLGSGADDLIRNEIENGTVLLAICGGFQLLGRYYETYKGERMNFTGILDFYTVGGEKRLIGNYAFKTADKMKIIGFENHSGRTYLCNNLKPLGKVIKGCGNNGKDKTEGVRYKNTFGTYCHGPLLPKNPGFADMLIGKALVKKYGKAELMPLDNSIELLAREQVKSLYI
ncbi:MAG: glutamine amidotransferase, partial [Eubacterium sp.]|nr:glutamine amidotransferase [Eubacterium sp.]